MDDITLTDEISVADTRAVTIDLNEHVLKASEGKSVINEATYGGAIFNHSGALTVEKGAFLGNSAPEGGAIHSGNANITTGKAGEDDSTVLIAYNAAKTDDYAGGTETEPG